MLFFSHAKLSESTISWIHAFQLMIEMYVPCAHQALSKPGTLGTSLAKIRVCTPKNILISQPKLMLKQMGKKLFTILRQKNHLGTCAVEENQCKES